MEKENKYFVTSLNLFYVHHCYLLNCCSSVSQFIIDKIFFFSSTVYFGQSALDEYAQTKIPFLIKLYLFNSNLFERTNVDNIFTSFIFLYFGRRRKLTI